MDDSKSSYAERNRATGLKRRIKTRAALVEAATRVVLKRGLEVPVIDDFISEAGISRGSFYNHFQTKEELFDAVVVHLRGALGKFFETAKQEIDNPAERLAFGIRFLIHSSVDYPKWSLLLQPMVGRLNQAEAWIRRGPKADLKAAIAKGYFPSQNIDVGVDLVIGATSEAVRAVASFRRPKDYPEQIATQVLCGLGMDRKEAMKVCYSPKPVLQLHELQTGEALLHKE